MRKASLALGGIGLAALAVLGGRAVGDDGPAAAPDAGVVVVRISREGTLAVTDARGALRRLDGSLGWDDLVRQDKTLELLRSSLSVRTRDPVLREPDGSSRLVLEVRAAARASWSWVALVLRAGADLRVKIYRIRFAAPDRKGEPIARSLPKDPGSVPRVDEARVIRVSLSHSERSTNLRIGSEEWSLPFGRFGDDLAANAARMESRAKVFDALRARIAGLREENAERTGEIAVATSKEEDFRYEDVWGVMQAFAAARIVGWRFEGAESPRAGPSSGEPPEGKEEEDDTIGLGTGAGGALANRGQQHELRARSGATKRAEDAVEHALRWLTAHQSADGGWEAAGWNAWCDGGRVVADLEGLGKRPYDVGVTGLALLAFLGAGYADRGSHPFAEVVGRGLRSLTKVQDAEGCFGPRASGNYVYNHAIAALAMLEAYGMTGSLKWRVSAQKALDFVFDTRNPYFAWRYGVQPGDNDTSITAWMATAAKIAELVNQADLKAGRPESLLCDDDAWEGVSSWLDRMTDPDDGRLGYQTRGTGPWRPAELKVKFPSEKSESMTAVGVFLRIFLGQSLQRRSKIRSGTILCSKMPPTWNPNDGSIDMYYWFWGTLALRQVGGAEWKHWEDAMRSAAVDNQRLEGDYCAYKGSWDPIDPWGPEGGRVYSTAILALCLEGGYRYERVLAR